MYILTADQFQTELVPLLRRLFRRLPAEERPAIGGAHGDDYYLLDALREPFTAAVAHRCVFRFLLHFSDLQCRAIAYAARLVGDHGLHFYQPDSSVSPLDPEEAGEELALIRDIARGRHPREDRIVFERQMLRKHLIGPTPARFFPLAADRDVETFIGAYRDLAHYPFEHALVSPSAKWAVLASAAEHAVLGGTSVFVDGYCTALSTTPQDLLDDYQLSYEMVHWRRLDPDRRASDWLPQLLAHVCGKEQARQLLAELPENG